MKLVFDASIHLGQFSISSEKVRIASKNAQVAISAKPENKCIGVISFNENSWVDHIVWGLDESTQGTFYKFMDMFHSVKNISRVPLSARDSKIALDLASKFHLDISNALTCAIAISQKATRIYTYYEDLLKPEIIKFMRSQYGIGIFAPPMAKELKYPQKDLENSYQASLEIFRAKKINLAAKLHKIA